DGIDVVADFLEDRYHVGQRFENAAVAHGLQAQLLVTVDQAFEHAVEQGGVAAEGIRGRDGGLAAVENGVDAPQHAVGQGQLAAGDVDLDGRCAGFDHAPHDLVGLRLQTRDVAGKGRGRLGQLDHQIGALEDSRGAGVDLR